MTASLRLATRGKQDRLSPVQLIFSTVTMADDLLGDPKIFVHKVIVYCSCMYINERFWEPVLRDWLFSALHRWQHLIIDISV